MFNKLQRKLNWGEKVLYEYHSQPMINSNEHTREKCLKQSFTQYWGSDGGSHQGSWGKEYRFDPSRPQYLSRVEFCELGRGLWWICGCCGSGEAESLADESPWLLTLEEVAAPDQGRYRSACETINPWLADCVMILWLTCWLTWKSASACAGLDGALGLGIRNVEGVPPWLCNVDKFSVVTLSMAESSWVSCWPCMKMSEFRLKFELIADLGQPQETGYGIDEHHLAKPRDTALNKRKELLQL